MKKIGLLLGIILSTYFLGQSQITITQSDLMQVGADIVMKVDTTHPTLNYGGTGSGQSWDFSSISPTMWYDADVVSPMGNVKSHLFPDANAVITYFGFNVQYYKNTATELTHLGTVVTFLDTPVFYFNYEYLRYPASLGSSFTDYGSSRLSNNLSLGFDPDQSGPHPFVDSIGTLSTTNHVSNIDAEGSVKTPEGTYNALRQHSEIISIDSSYMYANGKWQPMSALLANFMSSLLVQYDTSFSYLWIAEDKDLPVASIDYDPSSGTVLTAQWMQDGPVGTEITSAPSNFEIYPNPSNDVIHISHEINRAQIEIIDLKGVQVYSAVSNAGLSAVPVSSFENGQYLLLLKNEDGKIVEQRKIQILR